MKKHESQYECSIMEGDFPHLHVCLSWMLVRSLVLNAICACADKLHVTSGVQSSIISMFVFIDMA